MSHGWRGGHFRFDRGEKVGPPLRGLRRSPGGAAQKRAHARHRVGQVFPIFSCQFMRCSTAGAILPWPAAKSRGESPRRCARARGKLPGRRPCSREVELVRRRNRAPARALDAVGACRPRVRRVYLALSSSLARCDGPTAGSSVTRRRRTAAPVGGIDQEHVVVTLLLICGWSTKAATLDRIRGAARRRAHPKIVLDLHGLDAGAGEAGKSRLISRSPTVIPDPACEGLTSTPC